MDLLHHLASLYHSVTNIRHTLFEAHDMMISSSSYERAIETCEFLRLKLSPGLSHPRVAIVCGSGLGGLAQTVNKGLTQTWEYKDVPNFPISTGESTSFGVEKDWV